MLDYHNRAGAGPVLTSQTFTAIVLKYRSINDLSVVSRGAEFLADAVIGRWFRETRRCRATRKI